MGISYPILKKKQKEPSLVEKILALISLLSWGSFLVYNPGFLGFDESLNSINHYLGWTIIIVICPLLLLLVAKRRVQEPNPLFIFRNGFEYKSGWIMYQIDFGDIVSIEIMNPSKDIGLLLINVRYPKEVIKMQKRLSTRIFLKIYHLLYETPVVLNSKAFEIEAEALKSELEKLMKPSSALDHFNN